MALCGISSGSSLFTKSTHLGVTSIQRVKKCHIGASTRENLSLGCCQQQERRPARTSAQPDQCLCFLLFGKYHIQACYKRNFNFLPSLCSWVGWFESHFFWNPEGSFFRSEAHFAAKPIFIAILQVLRFEIKKFRILAILNFHPCNTI